MPLHPLFKTLATEPQLLLEHAAAYADLAGEETRQWLDERRQRALWLALGAMLLLLGLALAGGALLVLAAVPYASLANPLLLFVVPGVPLLGAVACLVWRHRQQRQDAFTLTRAQWAQDRQLLDQAANPS